jgi:hypothetical protein
MNRVVLSLAISPLVTPALILIGGVRPNMIEFAARALPICYALTISAAVAAYFMAGRAAPRFAVSVAIGCVFGVTFLFWWAGVSLAPPTAVVYLIYGGFGIATASVAHLIAFGFKRRPRYGKTA